jgi:hypothetical protein
LCQIQAIFAEIRHKMAGSQPVNRKPAILAGDSAKMVGSVQDLDQMAGDPAILARSKPESGTVWPESSDDCRTSLDSGIICQIPAPTDVRIWLVGIR